MTTSQPFAPHLRLAATQSGQQNMARSRAADRARHDALLAAVLRRYLTDGEYRYVFVGDEHLTLDASVPITPEERDVLRLLTDGS